MLCFEQQWVDALFVQGFFFFINFLLYASCCVASFFQAAVNYDSVVETDGFPCALEDIWILGSTYSLIYGMYNIINLCIREVLWNHGQKYKYIPKLYKYELRKQFFLNWLVKSCNVPD